MLSERPSPARIHEVARLVAPLLLDPVEVADGDRPPRVQGRFRGLGRQAGIEPAISLDEALALENRARQEWGKTSVAKNIVSLKESIAHQAEDQE